MSVAVIIALVIGVSLIVHIGLFLWIRARIRGSTRPDDG